MKFNEYQQQANQTDRQPRPGTDQLLTVVPLMGLAGESGELLTEHKKRLIDGQPYRQFPERVTEELGDILWYLSSAAARQGIPLGETALAGAPGRDPRTDIEMEEYQRLVSQGLENPQGRLALSTLFQLNGRAGLLLENLGKQLEQHPDRPLDPGLLKQELSQMIRLLAEVAGGHGLRLEDIARSNLEKVSRRWGPLSSQREQYQLFDQDYPEHEQLPRRMEIQIRPDGPGRTVTRVNGSRFGDPLTDNHYEDDGYRFHDIFHLSFAAILGWSPTTRALLRRKRRSNPDVDETEDGGRAIVLEEGIAAFVFDHAARRNFLEGIDRVDYRLLRNIRELTEHLEVARRTEADWEHAILRGFRIWREVRTAGEGRMHADLEAGTIRMAGTANN